MLKKAWSELQPEDINETGKTGEGYEDGLSLINTLSAKGGWYVEQSMGTTSKVQQNRISVGIHANRDSGSVAYFRTKRIGPTAKLQFSAYSQAGLVAESLESSVVARDASKYFFRPSLQENTEADRVREILSILSRRKSSSGHAPEIALSEIAAVKNFMKPEVYDALWAELKNNSGTARLLGPDGRSVLESKLDEAKQFVDNRLAGWMNEAVDKTKSRSYSPLISSSIAISEAIKSTPLWNIPPGTQAPPPPPDGAGLDDLIDKYASDVKIGELEKALDLAQKELDDEKPVASFDWLGGKSHFVEERQWPSVPIDQSRLAQVRGDLRTMTTPKRTRLSDEGYISPQDIWELTMGEMEVYNSPRKHTGKLLIMTDQSGSTGCPCDGNSAGKFINEVAASLASFYRGSKVYAYSNGIAEIPVGHRPYCNKHDGKRSDIHKYNHASGRVLTGGGTPDLEAILFGLQKAGGTTGTSVVIVCDGSPNSPDQVRQLVEQTTRKGAMFCSVLLSYNPSRDYINYAYPKETSVVLDWYALRHEQRRRSELQKLQTVFSILNKRH